MNGLKGRHQWRRHKLFKLRAKPSAAQKIDLFQRIANLSQHAARIGARIQNLRFAQFLCAAQEISRGFTPSLRGALATTQSSRAHGFWIASRSLSSGAHSRDPLARNDR
jgi:hypothetical protein